MTEEVCFSYSQPDDNEVELHISIGNHVSVGISFDGYGHSSWYVVSDDRTHQGFGEIPEDVISKLKNLFKDMSRNE